MLKDLNKKEEEFNVNKSRGYFAYRGSIDLCQCQKLIPVTHRSVSILSIILCQVLQIFKDFYLGVNQKALAYIH